MAKTKYLNLRNLPFLEQDFWYATMKGYEPEVDSEGNLTGDEVITYNNPVHAKARIGFTQYYDADTAFTKGVVHNRAISSVTKFPIDEFTVLWIDVEPVINKDGSTDTEPDYYCVAYRQDIHRNVWAIRKREGYEGNKD